jgi:hypothetical protein
VAGVSAHRRDEYLQAARLAIDPGVVKLELDLTPGIALADAILADIDRNRDGTVSKEEQEAYSRLVLAALDLEVDGRRLQMRLDAPSFPDNDAVRRGEGTIRLHSAAVLPPLSIGSHQLFFRNRHHPDRSVYLANALVPESDEVAVKAQRRDGDQSELTIEYDLRQGTAISTAAWLLGGVAGAVVLFVVLVRATGGVHAERRGDSALRRTASATAPLPRAAGVGRLRDGNPGDDGSPEDIGTSSARAAAGSTSGAS